MNRSVRALRFSFTILPAMLNCDARWPAMLLLTLVASCAPVHFPLPAETAWPAEMHGLGATEVLLRWHYDLGGAHVDLSGVGVIVHSSRERGTYVLANWHVVCSPTQFIDYPEGAHAEGPVGGTVSVHIHKNAYASVLPQSEWSLHEGKVVFGKMKVIASKWVENVTDALYLDVALIHCKTGLEPLKTARVAKDRVGTVGQKGRLRGIDTSMGIPYSRDIVFLSGSAFVPEGTGASGSGIYDASGELLGLLAVRRDPKHVSTIVLKEGETERTLPFRSIFYFVPIGLARTELERAGFAFLFP